ncbi:unnamed protein product [Prunus brigantina]
MNLKFGDFWVQIRNVPLLKMTEKLARSIGDRIGKCIDISQFEGGEVVGGFMRIRVRIDIAKPLWRGLRITFLGDSTNLVAFFYEKLPKFCFGCGRIGIYFRIAIMRQSNRKGLQIINMEDSLPQEAMVMPNPQIASLMIPVQKRRKKIEEIKENLKPESKKMSQMLGSEQRDRNWKNKEENGNIALTEAKKISEGGGSTSSVSTRSFEPNCQAGEKKQEICAISHYEADKALFGDFEVVIQSEFDLDS